LTLLVINSASLLAEEEEEEGKGRQWREGEKEGGEG